MIAKAWLEGGLRGPILGDGAMGTQLFAQGMPSGACPEAWGAEHPDAVHAIHKLYLRAGCQALTTNSFGGSRVTLSKHGMAERTRELNRTAAEMARSAAGTAALVLGSIGPCGELLDPYGDLDPEAAAAAFAEQAEALAEGGVDALVVETMGDPVEAALAIRAAKATGLPVLASFAFAHGPRGFVTLMGTRVADALRAANEAGADVVGANCGTDLDLDAYGALAQEMASAGVGAPLFLQPNAGAPVVESGQLVYRVTPEEMASRVQGWLAAGLVLLGGCCGTSPTHLAAMAGMMPGARK